MDNQQLRYCDEVMKFRKVLNLTSIKDVRTFYKTFIVPSLALSKWIKPGDVVLDIGSGMGVPGIPLLIHRSDIQGVLVERRKKRTEFIRHVIRKLKLEGKAFDSDIYDMPPVGASVCTARAVSNIETLLDMCNQHLVEGGRAVFPTANEAMLPMVNGWEMEVDERHKDAQRIVSYKKLKTGGVSRET